MALHGNFMTDAKSIAVSDTMTATASVANHSLKQIKVSFSTEVDKTTAETLANYAVVLNANQATSMTITSAKLAFNKKDVFLNIASPYLTAGVVYKVNISGVKSLAGTTMTALTTGNLVTAAADPTLPTIVASQTPSIVDADSSANYSAGDYFVFQMSEPVVFSGVTESNFTIANGHTFGTGATIAVGDYPDQIKVTLGTSPTVVSADTVQIKAGDQAAIADATGTAANGTTSATTFTLAAPVGYTTGPKLTTAVLADVNANGSVDTGDTITLTFDKNLNNSLALSTAFDTQAEMDALVADLQVANAATGSTAGSLVLGSGDVSAVAFNTATPKVITLTLAAKSTGWNLDLPLCPVATNTSIATRVCCFGSPGGMNQWQLSKNNIPGLGYML